MFHRNSYHQNIVKSHGCEIEIILCGLTEKQAFEKEKEFIRLYRNFGCCETNFTDGGEGASGHKHSDETKLKIARSGSDNPNFGNKMNDVSKLSISKSNSGRKMPKDFGVKRSNLMCGNKNPSFGRTHKLPGYEYTTPNGKFLSSNKAGKVHGVTGATIINRCRANKPGYNLVKLHINREI